MIPPTKVPAGRLINPLTLLIISDCLDFVLHQIVSIVLFFDTWIARRKGSTLLEAIPRGSKEVKPLVILKRAYRLFAIIVVVRVWEGSFIVGVYLGHR